MVMDKYSVGSVCSGIEAASVAWADIGFRFSWFSEIANFPSAVLKCKYPDISNLGDMRNIPYLLEGNKIEIPDIICGGTPCQAFSFAGWKKGLEDDRGNLTLKFVEIIEANDEARKAEKKTPSIVLWENVEGVLNDRTNAFGCFLSSLAGVDDELIQKKWPKAGILRGPKRNIAWRVLDAKYFGLPQQRRRLYVLAGGLDFYPENILFEFSKGCIENSSLNNYDTEVLKQKIGEHTIEVFRSYTDCLYSAYGTKWNGNAAAYNGSLFVAQNGKLRRFTPLECERLMGFPDHYTNIRNSKPTQRYQAIGNSWAVPVIEWIGERLMNIDYKKRLMDENDFYLAARRILSGSDFVCFGFPDVLLNNECGTAICMGAYPMDSRTGNIFEIIDLSASDNFYITPAGCRGILRRKEERNLSINSRLAEILENIASQWSEEKIEKISRKQTRGRYSNTVNVEQEYGILELEF